MAGCFGSSQEDRARERELDRYLESIEETEEAEETENERLEAEIDEALERMKDER